MKKMLVLGIVITAICFGFTACGEKGGTVKIVNDTDYRTYFDIRFDGKSQKVKDGITYIDPSQSVQAVSDSDTSYAVYIGNSTSWGPAAKHGDLSGGETITVKVSAYR
jgi:hypothetical protein